MTAVNSTTPTCTIEELVGETDPILDEGCAEEIEHYIEASGTERRIATAFLSQVWKETADKCGDDRKLAEAMASAALLLEVPAERYAMLAKMLDAARWRIVMAVLAHKDGRDILEKAGVSLKLGEKLH